MKRLLSFIIALLTIIMGDKINAEEANMTEKTLVVYFSKTGEQYGVGNITEGNTAIIAKMIAQKTNGDLFEIKLKNDNYPSSYKALTEAALAEKKANARPEIDGDVSNFDEYKTVFIGSPNWWADMPMALYTFMEAHDWKSKKIAPFVTHEGSGLSSIPSKIEKTTGAEMLDGFELYGHIAQNERDVAEKRVFQWLEKLGF